MKRHLLKLIPGGGKPPHNFDRIVLFTMKLSSHFHPSALSRAHTSSGITRLSSSARGQSPSPDSEEVIPIPGALPIFPAKLEDVVEQVITDGL